MIFQWWRSSRACCSHCYLLYPIRWRNMLLAVFCCRWKRERRSCEDSIPHRTSTQSYTWRNIEWRHGATDTSAGHETHKARHDAHKILRHHLLTYEVYFQGATKVASIVLKQVNSDGVFSSPGDGAIEISRFRSSFDSLAQQERAGWIEGERGEREREIERSLWSNEFILWDAWKDCYKDEVSWEGLERRSSLEISSVDESNHWTPLFCDYHITWPVLTGRRELRSLSKFQRREKDKRRWKKQRRGNSLEKQADSNCVRLRMKSHAN